MRFAVVSYLWVVSVALLVDEFQSALRFAVVSYPLHLAAQVGKRFSFQSALRFAVVSDCWFCLSVRMATVSIRFEVRGGFRPSLAWL